MKTSRWATIAVVLLASGVWRLNAQTTVDLTRQGKLGTGTIVPSQCAVGQVFFKTDAPPGALYVCSSTNVWVMASIQAGTGSGRPANCLLGQTWLATDTGAMTYCSATGSPGTWSSTLAGPAGPLGGANGQVPYNNNGTAAGSNLSQNSDGSLSASKAFNPPLCTVTLSATPAFDASQCNAFSLTLGGTTVTNSTLVNAKAGQSLTFTIVQDATGGRSFVWPSNLSSGCAVNPAANTSTAVTAVFDGTNANATGCTTSDLATLIAGPTRGAPGTPSTGLACWFDSTATTLLCKDTSGQVHAATKTAAARTANQFLTYVDASGVQQAAPIAAADLPTIPIANGGTNATTAAAALINLLPTATRAGDMLLCSAYSAGACTAWTLVAGNNTGTQYLQETASGVASWSTPAGGGGSVFTESTATASTGITGTAAAPILALLDQSVKSPVRFEITLTASTAVTSVTVNNKAAGAKFSVAWTEPSTNMVGVTWGASVSNTPCAVSQVAGAWTEQFFEIESDGATVVNTGCSSSDPGVVLGKTTIAAPTTAWTIQPLADNQTTTIPGGSLLAPGAVASSCAVTTGASSFAINETICAGTASGSAPFLSYEITLSNQAAITFSISNWTQQQHKIDVIQGGTTLTAVTWPGGGLFPNAGPPLPYLGARTSYVGYYNGTNYWTYTNINNSGWSMPATAAAPTCVAGTLPPSGFILPWADSTDLTVHAYDTSCNKFTYVKTAASATAHQWVDYIAASGVPHTSQPTPTDVSLGNVTNDAQAKQAYYPNTPPGAGQIIVGNAGGTAYAPVTMNGSCTLASTGAITCSGSGNLTLTLANAGTTGTTTNTFSKLTGAPSTAVISGTADTGGAVGVCTAGCGTTSNATITMTGLVTVVFDGATTAGHYVQLSGSVAGNGHDAGATYPTSGQVLGRVLSTNGGGGSYSMELFGPELQPASGGSMTWPSGAGIMVYAGGSAYGTSLAAPVGTIVGISDTQTLTNKRITARCPTCGGSPGSATTLSVNTDNADAAEIITSSTTTFALTLTGTPTPFQKLFFALKCTSTTTFPTLTFTSVNGSNSTALPTTCTGNSKIDNFGLRYDDIASAWQLIAVDMGH